MIDPQYVVQRMDSLSSNTAGYSGPLDNAYIIRWLFTAIWTSAVLDLFMVLKFKD